MLISIHVAGGLLALKLCWHSPSLSPDRCMGQVRITHQIEEANFMDNLKGFQGRFRDEIGELGMDISGFMDVCDFTRVKEQASAGYAFARKLRDIEESVKKINSREAPFAGGSPSWGQ